MRWKKLLILGIPMIIFLSCQTEVISLNEENIKSEIKEWWGAKIFEDVIVEDTVRVKRIYEVYARMVVCSDTLEQMKYEFEMYRKGWRVSKGPVDGNKKKEMIKEMLNIPLKVAMNNVIKSNMRDLEIALMKFASETGKFPANLDVKAFEMSYSVREYLGSYLRNPYIRDEQAIVMAYGDTSEWFSEYEGKVIYFPLDIDDIHAAGYVIKGSSDEKFLRCILKSH